MAQPPPRDGPRLRALDQRSLLKVSMKSRREQMKDNRDKAYASRGKKKLRGMLRAAAHQVKYTHDDRSELVRLLEEGQDPASIVGPLGAFRELPPRARVRALLRERAKVLRARQTVRAREGGPTATRSASSLEKSIDHFLEGHLDDGVEDQNDHWSFSAPAAFGAAAAPAAAPPAIAQSGEAAKDDDDDEGDDDDEELGNGRRLSVRHAPKLRRDSQAASGIITAAAMAETASHHHETSRPPFSTVLLTDVPSTGFRRRLPLTLDVGRESVRSRDASRFLEGLGAAPPFGVSSDVPASLAAAARHHLIAPEDADAFQEAGDGDGRGRARRAWFTETYGAAATGAPPAERFDARPAKPRKAPAAALAVDGAAAAPSPSALRARSVLGCASALMSRQLRSLCEESLDHFVAFFERFDGAIAKLTDEAAFELGLRLDELYANEDAQAVRKRHVVVLEPSLERLQEHCCDCIESIIRAAQRFPRVDVSAALGAGGPASPAKDAPAATTLPVLGVLDTEEDGSSAASGDAESAGDGGAAAAAAAPRETVLEAHHRSPDEFLGPATIASEDECVVMAKARVSAALARRFEAPSALVPLFEDFGVLLDGTLADRVRAAIHEARRVPPPDGQQVEIDATEASLTELSKMNDELSALADRIRGVTGDLVDSAMFRVQTAEAKELLAAKADALNLSITESVAADNREHMQDVCRKYQNIADQLVDEPTTSAELRTLKEFSEQAIDMLKGLEHEYKEEILQREKFLLARGYRSSKEDLAAICTTFNWPKSMEAYLNRSDELQENRKKHLKMVVEGQREQLGREVASLEKKVEKLAETGSLAPNEVQMVTRRVQAIREGLDNAQKESEIVVAQEDLLELQPTDHEARLAVVAKELSPLDKLWTIAREWVERSHAWHELPLTEVDAEDAAARAAEYGTTLNRVVKLLEKKGPSRDPARRACKLLIQEAAAFEQDEIPLMRLVCEPGMQQRHWDEIKRTTRLNFDVSPATNVLQLMDVGLNHYVHLIEDTCVAASKEAALDKALVKMEAAWGSAIFATKEWRTGRILAGIDEIQQELDDQIVKTQAMHGSRYVKPFLGRVEAWEHTLTSLQDIIDNWLKVQAAWLYLEPIFSSDDITRQMPTEASLFTTVNQVWIDSMAETAADPAVLSVATRPGLLDALVDANEKLETIQKGLNDYLETKRLAFPRFFFLSNDELLEILAETKDPTRVQPHLKKCFDGVANLEFTKNLDIMACLDAPAPKGERLEFAYDACNHKMINPKDSGGNVEKWLVEVEAIMKKSLANAIDEAVVDFEKNDRKSWLAAWQGQVVLTVNQITWGQLTEAAINRGKHALAELHGKRVDELMDVVEQVRGNIPKALRSTLGALVVMDVHNRDITDELAKSTISSPLDFDWQAQLRYYWEEGGASAQSGTPGTIPCRMINAMILYAYEYIGNCGRLVITPLTDRCYRTLMGAIHLNLGGAPEGPAGTGKTETTKDLGKAIAIQCVVTNCSDGLDYKAMGKFFKGLAASGAWACFDEFNRIQLEVLSVIAQQVLTIQQAKARKAERFMFEGTDLPLKPTCCPFITMNPGYAGRAELPDNLKVLFRTVAMMVPDYGMIGEILLYSMGYTDAKAMAIKIVTTYKLCSEQLSAQSHYDYGMRAVMAVLRAAGNLKRAEGHLPEDVLVLRSIIDVNLPKFLSPDVPLFGGITSDLFPGVELPVPDRDAMELAFKESCASRNLQPTKYFWEKVVQIYDMMVVRHGFMIVGMPFSGKTSAWKVLADTLGSLHDRYPDDARWTQVVPFLMNPKSITMGQLYGQFDDVSHEWTDGVLAINYRNAATSKVGNAEDRKWVLLDGPVDAIWIENMNTVLDDNKKLCLMSGEIIAMSDVMSMIFEPMDLLVASPATVSRCGMVYMEPEQLGLRPLFDSWLVTFAVKPPPAEGEDAPAAPFELTDAERELLTGLYLWLVEPAMAFLRRSCKEMSPTVDSALLSSLLNFLECVLTAAIPGKHDVADDASHLEGGSRKKHVECAFLFALIWSSGVTADNAGRAKYSAFVREIMESVDVLDDARYQGVTNALAVRGWKRPKFAEAEEGEFDGKVECGPPADGDLQDWCYDPRGGKWVNWVDTLEKFEIAADQEFSTIMVPTACTAQLSYMVQTLLTHGFRPLVCGPTGTGKSVCVTKTLTAELDQDKFKPLQLGFSAKTTAEMTQGIIDGQLGKRRKGVFGPPMGQTALVFVDDLNMPEVETYGAQPPIELLRQLVDSGGYYDLKEKSWNTIVDTIVTCAMGPPGGGRNGTTPRFLRHFHLLCVDGFDDTTLSLIFNTIVNHAFKQDYASDVAGCADQVVKATMATYRDAMRCLLPTPSKSHYTFNLRDFSRVIQGVLMQKPSDEFQDRAAVMRLWTHEALRVFGDRLTDDPDRTWFVGHAKQVCGDIFREDFEESFGALKPEDAKEVNYATLRRLFFGEFMTPADEDERPYAEISDLKALQEKTDEYLASFNSNSKKPMDLVMFMFAIEHVSRISRILRMPGGNALLVGVGGSGRQSLSILATEMAGYALFRIEITKSYGMVEWREDLKTVLKEAGSGERPVVFLFSDTQINREAFVEDINNMLNSGEVPNIFPNDEKVAICEAVRPYAKEQFGRAAADMTPLQLYAYFIQRVKQYLHIVLAFSPIGSAFRDRLRLFPSLVNCCAIDWFTAWPGDSLLAVAEKFLADVQLDASVRPHIVDMCMHFHQQSNALAAEFLASTGRITYVTPTSYLELIVAFKGALGLQRDKVSGQRDRYKNGLGQLANAEKNVATMQQELTDLQPVLKQSQKDTDALMEEIEEKLPGVREQEEKVGAEAAVAQKEADEVQIQVDSVQADLDEALPALESAIQALNTIKPSDINEVKALAKPPATVKLVCEAVCVMLAEKPQRIPDPDDPSKRIMDYWGPSQKMLADKEFIARLKTYDKDNIAPKIIKSIKDKYMAQANFTPEAAAKASSAAAGLCKWVYAMETYDRVAKVVACVETNHWFGWS
ncbi:dynein light chain binding protein [Aureococcus anophagefferens]|uniref:Dynein light chain binding protein n=1 Tax=Aureococcus anophagefferens TaxID=44056 RepID=A0ABR1FML3_AURAN